MLKGRQLNGCRDLALAPDASSSTISCWSPASLQDTQRTDWRRPSRRSLALCPETSLHAAPLPCRLCAVLQSSPLRPQQHCWECLSDLASAPPRRAEVTVRVAISLARRWMQGTLSLMTVSVSRPMRPTLQGGFFPELLLSPPLLCSLRTQRGGGGPHPTSDPRVVSG